jgi:hypothetical protein
MTSPRGARVFKPAAGKIDQCGETSEKQGLLPLGGGSALLSLRTKNKNKNKNKKPLLEKWTKMQGWGGAKSRGRPVLLTSNTAAAIART